MWNSFITFLLILSWNCWMVCLLLWFCFGLRLWGVDHKIHPLEIKWNGIKWNDFITCRYLLFSVCYFVWVTSLRSVLETKYCRFNLGVYVIWSLPLSLSMDCCRRSLDILLYFIVFIWIQFIDCLLMFEFLVNVVPFTLKWHWI